MADRLDTVNASFEDCEEPDDDMDIIQSDLVEATLMIDLDAVTLVQENKEPGAVVSTDTKKISNQKVISNEKYRAGL